MEISNSGRPSFKLYVSDLLPDRVAAARTTFGAIEYTPEIASQIQIYAPCAMGQVIRVDNIDDIAPAADPVRWLALLYLQYRGAYLLVGKVEDV